MKKLLSLFVIAIAALTLTSCKSNDEFKVGFIFLHDESSTYDANFINACKEVKEELKLTDKQVLIKTNIPEEVDKVYDAAADLVDQGCKVIFADSFGHEDGMVKAAKKFTDVQFCHATGVQAHLLKLANFHNAFASIYEGRYIAGIAAGMKLNQMIAAGKIKSEEAIMGYVGAFPYAEVISGFTSFYLGAKSVCPSVKMTVRYTNSWYNVTDENETAKKLINADKAVLISQHADSMGAPNACQEANVPNVFYNGTTNLSTYLVSSRINWAPYFKYMINSTKNGVAMGYDWIGTLATGSVEVLTLNEELAASGTKDALDAAKASLIDGTLKVFATANFTYQGKNVTSHLVDIDGDKKDEEVVSDGYFHESEKRSAPYFDLIIDGITSITE